MNEKAEANTERASPVQVYRFDPNMWPRPGYRECDEQELSSIVDEVAGVPMWESVIAGLPPDGMVLHTPSGRYMVVPLVPLLDQVERKDDK